MPRRKRKPTTPEPDPVPRPEAEANHSKEPPPPETHRPRPSEPASATDTPSPPSPEPDVAPDESPTAGRKASVAEALQAASATYLGTTLAKQLGGRAEVQDCERYLDALLAAAGQPADPMERMLIEQLAMMHHALGKLHVYVGHSVTAEHHQIYATTLARFFAEFRRGMLALKKYREQSPSRKFTVVKQQNLAAHQQVAFVEGKAADAWPADQTEVDASEQGVLDHEATGEPFPRPATRAAGQLETEDAPAVQPRRIGEAP